MEIKHIKDSLGGGVVGQVSHDLSMNQSYSRTGVICFHHPQGTCFPSRLPRESKAQEGQLFGAIHRIKKIMLYSTLQRFASCHPNLRS